MGLCKVVVHGADVLRHVVPQETQAGSHEVRVHGLQQEGRVTERISAAEELNLCCSSAWISAPGLSPVERVRGGSRDLTLVQKLFGALCTSMQRRNIPSSRGTSNFLLLRHHVRKIAQKIFSHIAKMNNFLAPRCLECMN